MIKHTQTIRLPIAGKGLKTESIGRKSGDTVHEFWVMGKNWCYWFSFILNADCTHC